MRLLHRISFNIVLPLKTNRNIYKIKNNAWNSIITIILTGGFYLGLLTIILSHIALVEFSYSFITHSLASTRITHAILDLEQFHQPEELIDFIIFFICVLLSIIVHEIGHVIALAIYQIRIHAVGIGILILFPYKVFVRFDKNEFKTLSKRERAVIQSAGVFLNYATASFVLLLSIRINWRILGWLYWLNIALALMSAIPLSETDGDKLFEYVLSRIIGGEKNKMRKSFAYTIGFLSWAIIVGSLLTIILSLLVSPLSNHV